MMGVSAVLVAVLIVVTLVALRGGTPSEIDRLTRKLQCGGDVAPSSGARHLLLGIVALAVLSVVLLMLAG